MTKKMKSVMLIAAITTAMASCQKMEELPVLSETKEMLTFSSVEEYNTTLEKINKMTDDEFAQWEKEKGFTSFYTQAQMAYAELEQMQSQEEIFAHVEKNAEFLQLIEDGEDYILETTLSEHSSLEKRILNGNKMVQIGDEVYKVFESGVAQVLTESKHELLKMNEKDFCNMPQKSSVKRVVNESSQRKDLFDKKHHSEVTDGRDRLYMGVEIKFRIPVGVGNVHAHYVMEYTIRPYRKTLGVWYWCTRTLSAELNLLFYYTTNGGELKSGGLYISYYNRSASVLEKTIEEDVADVQKEGVFFNGFTWKHIDCWATSAAIPNKRCEIHKHF